MTKELAVPEIDDRTKRIIWKGAASKSVSVLAEETGLTREAVLNIRNGMLEAVDALTIDQERQLIMVELHEVAQRAREEFESTPDARSKAPLLSAHISAMKLLLTQLKELEKAGSSQVDTLNAMRQRELLLVVRSAGDRFLDWVENQGIDRSEAQEVFHGFLKDASRDLESRNE